MATATIPTTIAPPTPAAPAPVTAEEFVEHYSHRYAELIDGILVEYGMPSGRHGEVAAELTRLMGNFVKESKLGRVLSHDTHILIRRDPDTVRGPDLCYLSYERLSPGPAPSTVIEAIPELVAEVRSPSNTWTDIFGKIGDYLKRGITAVLVLDPDRMTASVYRGTNGQEVYHANETLAIPDVLPGFAVPVAKFFE